jgi:hypothetical protein
MTQEEALASIAKSLAQIANPKLMVSFSGDVSLVPGQITIAPVPINRHVLAAMAMQGYLASFTEGDPIIETVARFAYAVADAMLKEGTK